MSVIYNMPQEQPNIVELLNHANNFGNQLAQQIANVSGVSQHDILYELLHRKNLHIRQLKKTLEGNFSGKVYLTDHIFHAVRLQLENAKIEFFKMQDIQKFDDHSIIILNNNNAMVDNQLSKYWDMYLSHPTCVFVIWDFDNHHWFALSSMLAASCDLYVPTHADNLEPLSRFNNYIGGPVGSGTIQWTKEYLRDNWTIITDTERRNEPLGHHIEYPQFPIRQKNLQILNQTLSEVKPVDGSYHSRDMMDRFKEWCSHKVHWIVPVLNDAPIRAYDALITGGIPILPRSLKYHRDIVDMHDHILFYDYEDVRYPKPITQKAVELFDKRGKAGILDRHNLVINNYHVDNRVVSILKAVQDEFNIPRLV